MITFERMAALPVPTHTWLGFDGATSIEPIEPVVDLPVADRLPRDAGVVGLPHAAADPAEVERVRLLPHAGIGRDASAARGADAPPLQLLERGRRHHRVRVTLGAEQGEGGLALSRQRSKERGEGDQASGAVTGTA